MSTDDFNEMDRHIYYAQMSNAITNAIGLTKKPVAVKLFEDIKDVPEGLKRPEKPIYYCEGVGRAMKGETILMLADDHGCDRGAFMLGVKEPPQTVVNGKMYANSHMVATPLAGKRLIEQAPKLPAGTTQAILLTPLSETPVNPDVIIFAATPHQALQLLNSTNFDSGIEIPLRFQILTSFCAYATVSPFKSGKPEATILQEQARKRSGLANEEMLVGFPAELLPRAVEVISGICCVVPQKPNK